MTFLTDKEELKPGLVIFRRTDVQHRNWYCRVKLPKADRYKTISLKTPDITAARDRARKPERRPPGRSSSFSARLYLHSVTEIVSPSFAHQFQDEARFIWPRHALPAADVAVFCRVLRETSLQKL